MNPGERSSHKMTEGAPECIPLAPKSINKPVPTLWGDSSSMALLSASQTCSNVNPLEGNQDSSQVQGLHCQ